MKRRALAAIIVLIAFAAPVPGHAADSPTPMRLKVMTFNIQYGAKLSPNGLRGVVSAIRTAGADVVGLQEPFGNTRTLARMLGWYPAPRLHAISRFPIVFPGGSSVPGNPGGHIPQGVYGYLLLGHGDVAALANTHTPSSPDGVKMVMQGAPRADVLAVENRVRVSWVQPHLDAEAIPISEGIPTFFTGDFNSPSHLDWTPRAVAALGWQPSSIDPPGRRYAVRWPVTVALAKAGFTDSYRAIHPDPVTDPGITYCDTDYPACARWDEWDRIDQVYAAGPVTPVASEVVGEGGPYSDIVSTPWPSDHRAVVSTFDVDRVSAPSFAAPLDERVYHGRHVRVAIHDPAAPGRTVGLWPAGEDPATDPPAVSLPVADLQHDVTVALDTTGLPPGPYTVALRGPSGSVIASSTVAVVDRHAPPTIAVSKRRYTQGDPIRVDWTGAPGNRYDWLVLNRDCDDPSTCPIRQWRYIDGRVFGSARFTRGSTGTWPVRPGRYRASLCIDDGFECLVTSAPFQVVAP